VTAIEHDKPSAALGDSVRIRFPLEDQALGEAEVLWAAEAGQDTFRLDNIPLFVFGVSMADLVRVRYVDQALEFDAVVDRGGHSTYRVMINEPSDPAAQQLFRQIVTLGCPFEQLTPRFLALDVPPEVDVFSVYGLLERGLEEGMWTFEEGHCGHPVDAGLGGT
jgi:hypothetical protein